jgi:hypothetical protein
VIAGKLMAAAGTKLIRGSYSAKAVTAVGQELEIALRAKVEVALYMSAAGRAA